MNEDGWSALHLAARAGAAEKVKLLLAAGADAGLTTKQGYTPLALVRARAPSEKQNQTKAVCVVCVCGKAPLLAYLCIQPAHGC